MTKEQAISRLQSNIKKEKEEMQETVNRLGHYTEEEVQAANDHIRDLVDGLVKEWPERRIWYLTSLTTSRDNIKMYEDSLAKIDSMIFGKENLPKTARNILSPSGFHPDNDEVYLLA